MQLNRQQNFQLAPGNTSFTIAVTAASANLAIPAGGVGFSDLALTNASTTDALWFAIGDTNAVTATVPTAGVPTNSRILLPGQTIIINTSQAQQFIAAIALATKTPTLYGTTGMGSP